jgi:DNA repair exonuclease SbcCD nuclease subunit
MAKKHIETKMHVLAETEEIIFISDVHFGARNGSFEWLDIMKDYFHRFFLPLVEKEISSGKHPIVVVAGDYFDNRQYVDINVLNVAYNIMDEISSKCDVYMMVGNHDIYKKNDTDVNSLVIFNKFAGVHIVSQPECIVLKNGCKFLLVPWVGDMSQENKIISGYKDDFNYLVFHTEISGMTYDNNRPIMNGLNLSVVDDNCRILSGHIHKRQESKKGLYFGSPYHLTRSDIGNEKGIYIFSCEGEKMKRTFVKNDISPVFKTVSFAEVGKDPKNWADITKGNFVDIVFTQDELDSINVNKFMKEIQEFMPKKIEIAMKKVEKVEEETEDKSLIVTDEGGFNVNATIENVFNAKVAAMDLKKTEVKQLTALNDKFIKAAQES